MLLNPARSRWRKFKREYPLLARGTPRIEQYKRSMSYWIGRFLEEYAAQQCVAAIDTPIHTFTHVPYRNDDGDIDLVVVGPKRALRLGILNSHYFAPQIINGKLK